MITTKLVEIDRPTINGRIYSQTVLESALKHWQEHFQTKTMPIFKAPSAHPKVEDIVGYAENFRFEEGYLVADVGFLQEKINEVANNGEVINIRPNGIGSVDAETGKVHEGYRMVGLTIRRNPVVGLEIKVSDEKI
jgi:hypothetical protein